MFSEFFPCKFFFSLFGMLLVLVGTLLPFTKTRYDKLRKRRVLEWVSERRKSVFWGVLFLGIFLRTLNVDLFLITDESFYIYAAKQVYLGYKPYSDFFFSQPPFEIYLTAFSFEFLGLGLLQARLLPFIFSILSMVLVYLISRKVYGKTPDYALLSLALFSLTQSMIVISPQAILYSTMIFTALSSLYLFILGLEQNNVRFLFAAGVLAGLSFWSKLSGVVVLAAESLYVLWVFREKSVKPVLAVFSGFSLVFLAFFIFFYSPGFIHQVFIHHSLFADCPLIGKLLLFCVVVLYNPLIVLFGALGVTKKRDNKLADLFILLLFFFGLLLFALKHPCIQGNIILYFAPLTIPLSILGAKPLGDLTQDKVFWLLGVFLFTLLLVGSGEEYTENLFQASDYVKNNLGENDLIIGNPTVAPAIAFICNVDIPLDGIEFFMNRFYAENTSEEYFQELMVDVRYAIALENLNDSRIVHDFLVDKKLFNPPKQSYFSSYLNESCYVEERLGKIILYRCS